MCVYIYIYKYEYKYVCMYVYIYIYIYTYMYTRRAALRRLGSWPTWLKIHQRGVQWKQGVVIYMMLHTRLLYNYYPHPLHPPPSAPPCNEYPLAGANTVARGFWITSHRALKGKGLSGKRYMHLASLQQAVRRNQVPCGKLNGKPSSGNYLHHWDTLPPGYMHTCIHAYMPTCIHAYMLLCIHAYMHTCIHAYIHTCIHAFMHTCIHSYMHTYVHARMHACMYACVNKCTHTHTSVRTFVRINPALVAQFPPHSRQPAKPCSPRRPLRPRPQASPWPYMYNVSRCLSLSLHIYIYIYTIIHIYIYREREREREIDTGRRRRRRCAAAGALRGPLLLERGGGPGHW